MEVEAILEEVRREYLRRMTCGNGRLLQQVEQYVTARRGKMLRPRLTLLAAAKDGAGTERIRRTVLLATCVEMLHNASLLHDDVVDCADERRGQPSVNVRWNSRVAVLVGDYHLARVMELLDEVNEPEASRLVNQTVMAMVESELLQQEVMAGLEMNEDIYLKIIDGKTARLFSMACAFGNPQYADFGLHYGRLFQLRDDLADGEDTPWTRTLMAREEEILERMPLRLELPLQ